MGGRQLAGGGHKVDLDQNVLYLIQLDVAFDEAQRLCNVVITTIALDKGDFAFSLF
jgi:hypothetical protein